MRTAPLTSQPMRPSSPRLLTALATFASTTAAQPPLPHVLIATEKGNIIAEVDTVHAPITGANFLRYVDEGSFSSGRFFRTVRGDNQAKDSVRIDVIQAGAKKADTHPAIPLERT